MKFIELELSGCFLIEPTEYKDHRGAFFESYNQEILNDNTGQTINFVQDNHSTSNKGVLRGLHFQEGTFSQAKLVRVGHGKVLDVIVDIREGSNSFGKHFKVILSAENKKMLFIPRGFAHGFLALEDHSTFMYKCDNYYKPSAEGGIIYNDPELNIDWEYPVDQIVLSDKDLQLPPFKALQL